MYLLLQFNASCWWSVLCSRRGFSSLGEETKAVQTRPELTDTFPILHNSSSSRHNDDTNGFASAHLIMWHFCGQSSVVLRLWDKLIGKMLDWGFSLLGQRIRLQWVAAFPGGLGSAPWTDNGTICNLGNNEWRHVCMVLLHIDEYFIRVLEIAFGTNISFSCQWVWDRDNIEEGSGKHLKDQLL